jgi:hypothetical protein
VFFSIEVVVGFVVVQIRFEEQVLEPSGMEQPGEIKVPVAGLHLPSVLFQIVSLTQEAVEVASPNLFVLLYK